MRRTDYRFLAVAAVLLGLWVVPTKMMAQFPRTVVIEEFTSITCAPCVAATKVLNEILEEKGGSVVTIRYHKNIPTPGDPWYVETKTSVDPRFNLYDPVGLPHARVGGIAVNPTDKAETLTEVNSALQLDAPVKLEVTQNQGEGGSVDVSVDVTAGGDGLGVGYRLYVGIVESHIELSEAQIAQFEQELTTRYNKETELHDLFRGFANNPNGQEVLLNSNENKNLTFSYDLGEDWNPEEIYVVAFIQDEFSLDVIQAGFSSKLPSSVREVSPVAGYELEAVFPNPTMQNARLNYTLAAPERVELSVYTTQGELVRSLDLGRVEGGTHSAELDLDGLPAGAYTLSLSAGRYLATEKLTIVK